MKQTLRVVGLAVVGVLTSAAVAVAAPNDGTMEAVSGDSPSDVLTQVQDRAIEWTPTVITIFGTILAFGFAMVLLALGVRKALSKLTMLVRKS